jgi:hypothetical protein
MISLRLKKHVLRLPTYYKASTHHVVKDIMEPDAWLAQMVMVLRALTVRVCVHFPVKHVLFCFYMLSFVPTECPEEGLNIFVVVLCALVILAILIFLVYQGTRHVTTMFPLLLLSMILVVYLVLY